MFILVLLKPVLLNILFNSLLFIYLFLILFNIQNGGVLENGFEIFKCYKLSQVLSDFFLSNLHQDAWFVEAFHLRYILQHCCLSISLIC